MVYTIKAKHLKDFRFEKDGRQFRLIPQPHHKRLLSNRLYYIMYNSKRMLIEYVKVNV
jgi:hypothetical protein